MTLIIRLKYDFIILFYLATCTLPPKLCFQANYPVSRCVRVSVFEYVRVLPFCVNIDCRVLIFLTIHLNRIEHFQTNDVRLVFFSFVLAFIFKVKLFAFYLICQYHVNGQKQIKHYHCHQIGSHIFVGECDLVLAFQGQQFVYVNFSETARASSKMRDTTLVKFDICHRITLL